MRWNKVARISFLSGSPKSFFHLLLHGKGPFVLLSFQSDLKCFDLVLQEFIQELTQLIEVDLARFVLLENFEDVIMRFLERGVGLTFYLISFQEQSHKGFNLFDLKRPLVVCVDGIIDILGHLSELVDVYQNIGQILDGFLVVHDD